jgi:hypothetical protein
MKQFLVIVFLFLILVACSSEKELQKPSITELENTTHHLLNDWHKAAAEADFTRYFSHMDSASVFVGTDAEEVWNKTAFMEFSKPYFDKGKAWSFTPFSRNMYIDSQSEVIWFDELLDTWMGECRGSGVLKKKDTSWLIQHYVLSLTIPNEEMNRVIEVLTKKEALVEEER